MRRGWGIVLALAMVATSFGQTLSEYLALRKANKITTTVSLEALDSLVGQKILEVRGVVKGMVRVDQRSSLLLQKADGSTLYVNAAQAPSWLDGASETPVRMIVRASREHETADLQADLISALAEAQIAAYEARQKPVAKAAPRPSSAPSRGSRGSLSGQITSRGTRLNRSAPSSAPKRSWSVPQSDATPIYAQFIKNQNPRLSDRQAYQIAQELIGFSLKHGVDARLVVAVVMVESGFNPNVTSSAGAMGLMQLMPGTARSMGVSNAYDTTENLYGAIKYLRKQIDSHGDLVLALAAYNAGPGNVRKHGGVPPFRETQNYVRKVSAIYRRLVGG
jgi:soluble lytic murein transglycosylase-like protein